MPRTFRAPGRVNLIGDHTDYTGGFVMPMAIQLETRVSRTPRSDQQLVMRSTAAPDIVAVDLSGPFRPRRDWTDYVAGVAKVLLDEGLMVRGADLEISSTVPQGSGLSSSAALEVATAFALLDGNVPDRLMVARWCQRAENEFVGARCGIMDQYIACLGVRDHALLIDCRSLDNQPVPIPHHAAVVVGNTMVKHSVAGGEYNRRRAQCESAAEQLHGVLPHVRSLRDVTLSDLAAHRHVLTDVAFKRARHVVSENARVRDAAEALTRGDLARVGQLMRDSHTSLRDDFDVSAPALDAMVDIANDLRGVWGSRMTGGGFGGSTVTLADIACAPAVARAISDRYARHTGTVPEVIICTPSAGASEHFA
jgi:galactokinase